MKWDLFNAAIFCQMGVAIIVLTVITSLLVLYVIIMQIVARCQMFKKMGLARWKCLIPIYYDYCIWKNVWTGDAYVLYIAMELITTSICGYTINLLQTTKYTESMLPLLAIICSVWLILVITMLVFYIKYIRRFAAAFGMGSLFAFALFFIPYICELVIGFGMSKYLGNKSSEFEKKK